MKPKSIPVPVDVIVEFCWWMRCQHPENRIWPSARTGKAASALREMATNYGWGLDPTLPWMDEFEGANTLLRAAYDAWSYSSDNDGIPSAKQLSQTAVQLWKAHQEATANPYLSQPKKPLTEIALRCQAVWQAWSLYPVNPSNPYAPVNAEKKAEILAWWDENKDMHGTDRTEYIEQQKVVAMDAGQPRPKRNRALWTLHELLPKGEYFAFVDTVPAP